MKKDRTKVIKKYTRWYDCRVYAIYYRDTNTVYYNLDCRSEAGLVVIKDNGKEGGMLAKEK